MASRLFKNIRDKKGLVYTIYGAASAHADAGTAYTYFGADLHKAIEALKLLLSEYDNVLQKGIEEHELKRVKKSIIRQLAEKAEDSLETALSLGSAELHGGEAMDDKDFFEKYIAPITINDLLNVAPKLLTKENLSLAVVGPLGDKSQEFEKILLS